MQQHTFVIPAYQQSPYLEQCIASLLAQTVSSQIMITTSTPSAFLDSMAKRYHLPLLINPQPNGGIAGDWNFALQQASTPLVTIAHQDDVYAANYAEQAVKRLSLSYPLPPLIAFTDYEDLVGEKIRKRSRNSYVKRTLLLPFLLSEYIKSSMIKKAILLFGDPICCPSVTFNKPVLTGFAFSTEYKCALDWLAWIQLAQKEGGFVYINQKLVQHRIHQQSETMAQITNGTRLQEERRIFELLWGKFIAGLITRFYAAGHQDNL